MLIENYINGNWVKTKSYEYFVNISPHDQSSLDQFPESNIEDMKQAIEAANAAFTQWSKLSGPQRGQYLFGAACWLSAHLEDIARDLTKEEGKTFVEAKGEVNRAVQTLYYYAAEGSQPNGDVIPSMNPDLLIYTKYVPIGVVGLITPWNFPIAIPTWKIAPALIFGNTVVLKPSEYAPKSAYYLIRAFEEAGLPAGVVNCVFGSNSKLGEELVKNVGTQGISFTGSNQVGTIIQHQAARYNKKVQLEMGGNNPLVVLNDADIDKAITYTISDAFSSAGQKCTAASRIIIEDAVYEEFKQKLIERTNQLTIGNPNNDASFLGPVVSEKQYTQIKESILNGKNEVTLLLGKEPIEETGYYIRPTIFEVDSKEASILQEEIFGPVISLIKVNNFEKAIQIANETQYGLSAAIFTNNLAKAQTFIEEVEVGMIHINTGTVLTEVQAPFGGAKQSSVGPKEQGKAAKEFYTKTKIIYQSS